MWQSDLLLLLKGYDLFERGAIECFHDQMRGLLALVDVEPYPLDNVLVARSVESL